ELVSHVLPLLIPLVGTAFAVCTSHYSPTLGNIEPPSSCRCDPVEMIPHFQQKGDPACSRPSFCPCIPRSKGMPERLDSHVLDVNIATSWSSVSVIFRSHLSK